MDLRLVLELVDGAPEVTVPEGETLLAAGESSTFYVLVSGSLEVRRGGVPVASITQPGATIGEIGLLLEQPANSDVVATSDVTVLRVDDAAGLFESQPQFARLLATELASRLHQISGFLADVQEQFAGSATMAAIPTVLRGLIDEGARTFETGSDREADSPY